MCKPLWPVEPKTQTYHERVCLGRRAAGRRGGAEPDTVGHRRVDRPRSQLSCSLPRESNTTVLDDSSEARTKESLGNWKGEQNSRLTIDWQPVFKQFITGTASALRSRSWLLISVPTPICLCKPFSCTACPEHAGTKSPVDNRFIRGFIRDLSAGREALFLLGCWPVNRRLPCLCKPFSCKVRKTFEQKLYFIRVYSFNQNYYFVRLPRRMKVYG